jgi:protoporphyrin/coproporphyrin ferrochelatase
MPHSSYEALLVVSFGGPERHEDVIPFLENVLRGKNVPRERMLEVAEHYYHFDGKSPINDQNRALLAALRAGFESHSMAMPVYWGNRNWKPFLNEALLEMQAAGIRRAAVFVTSAYGSYSGCRQYREDVGRALNAAGITNMVLEKLPHFCMRREYIEVMTERVQDAYAQIPEDRRAAAPLVFTAHSIPLSMAETSPYVGQLEESSRSVAAALGRADQWALVYQSRSGPPAQPWLEPDILSHLRSLRAGGFTDAVVCPIGFCSDHMEVLFDLDTEARELCAQLGLNMVRAATAGTHPKIIEMIRVQVQEPAGATPILARCSADCCPEPPKRPVRA